MTSDDIINASSGSTQMNLTRKKVYLVIFVTAIIAFWHSAVKAEDITIRIADGFGRPISAASVEIYWYKQDANARERKVDLTNLVSDSNGIVSWRLIKKEVPAEVEVWLQLSKTGYETYATLGTGGEYVLKRKFDASDLDRVAHLAGEDQFNNLRELLGGSFEGRQLEREIFANEDRFAVSLHRLLQDSKVGSEAGAILAFAGDLQDINGMVKKASIPNVGDGDWKHLAYIVVTALTAPTIESRAIG